jgi:hypothetical protein
MLRLAAAEFQLEPANARMVKKLIFASKEGKFTRPKAHAACRSPKINRIVFRAARHT